MPRAESQEPLLPCLLDRLIDLDPDVSMEPAWSRSQGLWELKESVKRDLETLLNSRRSCSDLPEDFVEASQSMLTYGLPDISTASVLGLDDRERLRQEVEDTIRRFEPRLMDVQVMLREAAQYRSATSDHKSMWVNSNVTRLLREIVALERAFGLDR